MGVEEIPRCQACRVKKNAEFHIELGEYFQGQRRDFALQNTWQ